MYSNEHFLNTKPKHYNFLVGEFVKTTEDSGQDVYL